MLGMEAFQLLPVPESPGNAYRLKTGAQSCFHICVGITEIQALLRLYSKPVQNQLYTCRIRLSGNSRLFSGYQAIPPEMLRCSSLPLGRVSEVSFTAVFRFRISSRMASWLS